MYLCMEMTALAHIANAPTCCSTSNIDQTTSVFYLFATYYISLVTSVLIETHVHKWTKLRNTQLASTKRITSRISA